MEQLEGETGDHDYDTKSQVPISKNLIRPIQIPNSDDSEDASLLSEERDLVSLDDHQKLPPSPTKNLGPDQRKLSIIEETREQSSHETEDRGF